MKLIYLLTLLIGFVACSKEQPVEPSMVPVSLYEYISKGYTLQEGQRVDNTADKAPSYVIDRLQAAFLTDLAQAGDKDYVVYVRDLEKIKSAKNAPARKPIDTVHNAIILAQ